MKKYLKTPEEVVDALKEGKTVYSCCGKYRMHNGIVVQEHVNYFTVNPCLLSTENLYIKESEPLIIEVGKFYKRRDGRKVRCYFANDRYASFSQDYSEGTFSVDILGSYCRNTKEKNDFDIIGPWEE